MTTLQAGDRIITAANLDNEGWHPTAAERRRAGVRGVVKKWEPEVTGNRGKLLKVIHDDLTEAEYYTHELNPIRERAVEEAISSPERVALDELEAGIKRFRAAVAVDLAGLDARIGKLEGPGQDSERVCRQGADRLEAEAAVAAARKWCELSATRRDALRQRITGLDGAFEHELFACAAVLEAAPELLRLIEERPPRSVVQAYQALHRGAFYHQQAVRAHGAPLHLSTHGEKGIWAALERLAELTTVPDEIPDEIPDSAPPLSEAGQEVLQLRADVDLLVAERDGACQRLEQARERLANMTGAADGLLTEMLTWLEPRLEIMSELEAFSPGVLNDTAEGLEHLGGDESAYIGAQLYHIAALADPPDEGPDSEEPPDQVMIPTKERELYRQLHRATEWLRAASDETPALANSPREALYDSLAALSAAGIEPPGPKRSPR